MSIFLGVLGFLIGVIILIVLWGWVDDVFNFFNLIQKCMLKYLNEQD